VETGSALHEQRHAGRSLYQRHQCAVPILIAHRWSERIGAGRQRSQADLDNARGMISIEGVVVVKEFTLNRCPFQ
jgi:hypothetical protein